VVLATQRVFRRQLTPQWHCALWLLVVARLLPFSFSSDVSLFNFVSWFPRPEQPSQHRLGQRTPAIDFSVAPPPALLLPSPAQATTNNARTEEAPTPLLTFLPVNTATALLWLWLLGAAMLAGRVLISTLSLARATAHAKPVVDPVVLERLRRCGEAMRIRRLPLLVETPAVSTPALHGLIRSRVLLPPGFTTAFSAEEQRFVFLHELAHVRRHDLWLNWLIATLQILHWFNPLVWFAFARWRIDREIACDAAALEAGRRTGAPASSAFSKTTASSTGAFR
jgi:bla regulator protein BlaR1